MSYKIFEEQWDVNFYIKLESAFPSQMSFVALKSLYLTESITTSSPLLSLNFLDGFGDLMTKTYVSPDASYDLFLGKNVKDAKKNSFSLSMNSINANNMNTTTSTNNQIVFVSDKWGSLIKHTISRGWRDVRYSDVVTQIANEAGLKIDNIEKTNKKFNVIQPFWSNYQLLKWLMMHSRNQQNIGGYDMLFYLDGRFSYTTYNTLFSAKPYKSYGLGDNDPNVEQILNFSIDQSYMPTLIHGGFGEKYSYFDFESGTFKGGEFKQSQSKQTQLADWFFLAASQEDAPRGFYAGRDQEAAALAENQVSSVANSVQRMEIMVKGDVGLHIGQLVNLIIKPYADSKQIINEFYSGYWMISKVTHQADFGKRQFVTRLELARSGINGKNISGLIKTQAGKKVTPTVT